LQKYETLRRRSQQPTSNHTPNILPYLEAYMTLSEQSFASANIEHIHIHV